MFTKPFLVAVIVSLFTQVTYADEYVWKVFAQPTAETKYNARKINELKVFNNRLYIGHGDYGINTGPTDVISCDLQSGEARREFTVQEEAITLYRVLDGKLVVPGVDSTEGWELGNIYVLEKDGWKKLRTVPKGVHVFDVIAWNGRWYASIGSSIPAGHQTKEAIRPGAVLSSSDQGKTWRWEYTTPHEKNRAYRVSSIVPFGNRMYMFGYAYGMYPAGAIPEPYRKGLIKPYKVGDQNGYVVMKQSAFGPADAIVSDGREWNHLDCLPVKNVTFISAFTFGNRLCMNVTAGKHVVSTQHYNLRKDGWPSHIKTSLHAWNGKTSREIKLPYDQINDVLVKGDRLHLLLHEKNKYRIASSSDLEKWASLNLPHDWSEPKSIETHDNAILVGLIDGKIMRGYMAKR